MIRDPSDIKNSNVWQNPNKSPQSQINPAKRTLIVLGDEQAGKTSFIKLIKGDFDLNTNPTRLIDFFTMKKQGVEIEIYEISSPKFEISLQFLVKEQNCSNLTLVLCVDLTKPQNLVNRVNQKIQHLRVLCKQIISSKKLDQIPQYNQQHKKCYQFIQQNDDIQIIKRMPFKFCIIGCKFDLFEKTKPDEKKWVSRCLRYLAHTNEASLLFSSTKNMQTGAELRSVFVQELLGMRSKSYSNQKDHNKAIFILTGEDKISEMSLPAFNNSGAFNEIKILQQQLESVFPSKKNIEIEEKEKKGFKSIGLDYLISKCNKEISQMMKERKIKIGINSERDVGYGTATSTGFGFS